MKCLVVFTIIAVAFASAQIDPSMKKEMLEFMTEIATTCAKTEGASAQELADLISKKLPTSKEGKCLLACFNEKVNMQTPDGKMTLDGAMKTIEVFKGPAPQVYEGLVTVIKTCVPQTESQSDRCEVASIFANCAHGKAVELGIFDWA